MKTSQNPPSLPTGYLEAGYAHETALTDGLQVPSRYSYVTSGFKYPAALHQAGVTKKMWTTFTHEIKDHASLSPSQWLTTIGTGAGVGLVGNFFFAFMGLIPAGYAGHKARRDQERRNFAASEVALMECVARWNREYFSKRGINVRIDLPGEELADMELSTSKRRDSTSKQSPHNEKDRRKASYRARIVIIPLSSRDPSNRTDLKSKTVSHDDTFSLAETEVSDSMSDVATETPDDEVTLFTPLRRRDPYPNEPKP